MTLGGWTLLHLSNDEMHVTPDNDLREHDDSPSCWCRPIEDDEVPGLWAHNSLDRREEIEEQRSARQ